MNNKVVNSKKALAALHRDDFIELLKVATYADPKCSIGKILASIIAKTKTDLNVVSNGKLVDAVKDFIEQEANNARRKS